MKKSSKIIDRTAQMSRAGKALRYKAGLAKNGKEQQHRCNDGDIRIEHDKSSLADRPIGKTSELGESYRVITGRKESIPDTG